MAVEPCFKFNPRMTAPIQLSRKKAAKHPSVRWHALNEFCVSAHVTNLTPVQRVACLAYWYMSGVEMGGHHDYFSQTPHPDSDEVAAALRYVGAIEQASILVAAHKAVTMASGRAPAEHVDRYLAGVEFADLVNVDEAFDRCTRPIATCLVDYLDKHENEFIEWKL